MGQTNRPLKVVSCEILLSICRLPLLSFILFELEYVDFCRYVNLGTLRNGPVKNGSSIFLEYKDGDNCKNGTKYSTRIQMECGSTEVTVTAIKYFLGSAFYTENTVVDEHAHTKNNPHFVLLINE